MKRLKEWLSDNLRYLILFLAVIVGVFAIVLGVRLYGLLSGQVPVVQDPVTERVTERTDEIIIIGNDETESESEAVTEAVTEKLSERETESETSSEAETAAEGESGSRAGVTGRVQNVKREETESETQRSSTQSTQNGVSVPAADDGSNGQARETENNAAASDSSQVNAAESTAVSGEAELKTLKSRAASTMYVNTESNIRSGPGTNYRIVSYASYGEALQVTGETTSWYQVKTDAGTGYIAKSLMDEDEIYIEPEYATIVSACNIRSTADYGDNVIGELYGGEQVEVHYVDGWAYITYNGITGYIGSKFISY